MASAVWTPQLTTAGDSTGWTLVWTSGLDGGHRTIGLRGGQPGVSAQGASTATMI